MRRRLPLQPRGELLHPLLQLLGDEGTEATHPAPELQGRALAAGIGDRDLDPDRPAAQQQPRRLADDEGAVLVLEALPAELGDRLADDLACLLGGRGEFEVLVAIGHAAKTLIHRPRRQT